MRKREKAPAQPETILLPPTVPEDAARTPPAGLDAAEVLRRQQQGQDNRQTAEAGKSVARIFADNLFTLFNLLNLALALCLALVGSWRNMLFCGVVISNLLIGTVQELRARRTLNKLRLLQARPVHPIRGGAETECAPEQLVLGDLVVLRAGEQLPADAVITEGNCAADESLLTGESEPVPRGAGQLLLSGSFLTEGKVTAQLIAVGDQAYAARLTREAKRIRSPKSELMTELGKLVALVSKLLVPLGLLLFAKEFFLRHTPLEEAVPAAVAAMIGMIPEGLILLTSVALMAGVVKLGRRRTLVQELFGIETLARVDTLCVDKTGTLTTGEMTLERLVPLESDAPGLEAAFSRFLAAFEAGTGTLRALTAAIPSAENTATAVLPFSSARKLSAASYPDGTTLVLGAPSFVTGGQIPPEAEQATAEGYRVLLLAGAEGLIREDAPPPVTRLLGLALLKDTLRPTAKQTLAWFRDEGVCVRVLSGDDPRTVAAVARQLELPGCDRLVDCAALSDEALREAAKDCVIFGRLTPDRKRILVEALKAAGHSVAMTGDGVNDIPSLKAADCSIAMAGGAEATERSAQLVLLDSDFAALPAVVAEGRRVIGNITRTASLFLVKTMYSLLLSVLLLVLPLRYPFQPIQLTLVSSLTVGVPSFFLALEPSSERAKSGFLRRILLRAAPGGIAVTVCALAATILNAAGMPFEIASTMAVVSAGAVGLFNLALTCYPFTKLRTAICIVMTLGFIDAVAAMPEMFYLHTGALGANDWLTLAGITAVGVGLLLGGTLLVAPRMKK